MPDSHRTFLSPPPLAVAPDPSWEFTSESFAAEWARAANGDLINVGRADAIVLRKVGDDVHEVRVVWFATEREPILFRGTFREAGDVLAQLGDAIGAYVPSTEDVIEGAEGPES